MQLNGSNSLTLNLIYPKLEKISYLKTNSRQFLDLIWQEIKLF